MAAAAPAALTPAPLPLCRPRTAANPSHGHCPSPQWGQSQSGPPCAGSPPLGDPPQARPLQAPSWDPLTCWRACEWGCGKRRKVLGQAAPLAGLTRRRRCAAAQCRMGIDPLQCSTLHIAALLQAQPRPEVVAEAVPAAQLGWINAILHTRLHCRLLQARGVGKPGSSHITCNCTWCQ